MVKRTKKLIVMKKNVQTGFLNNVNMVRLDTLFDPNHANFLPPAQRENILAGLRRLTKDYSKLQDYKKALPVKPLTRWKYVIVMNNGQPIGFVRYLVNNRGRIVTLSDGFLDSKFQKKGVHSKMLNWFIHRARGLGRYSLKISWIDPISAKPSLESFAAGFNRTHTQSSGQRRRSFKIGLRAHTFHGIDKSYIKNDYGEGESFKRGLEKFRKENPDPVLRKGAPPRVSDFWIQMRQRKVSPPKKPRPVPGPKKPGKTLFRPKRGLLRK